MEMFSKWSLAQGKDKPLTLNIACLGCDYPPGPAQLGIYNLITL